MPPYTNTTFDSDKGVVFSPNTSSKQAPVKYVSNGNGGLDVAPSEPAVLSSSNISDTVIPQNRAKLEQLSTKGTTVGADGVHLYADGSVVPAPPDAELTDGVYTSGGKNYAAPAQDTGTNDDDPESRQINALLESMRSSLDASTKGQVDAIHTQFQQLRADQMDANTRNEKSRAQSLLLGGSSRYAPLSAASTMLAQTSYGLRQIQGLDAAENTAIANAKKAEQDGDMQLMQTQLQLVEKKREEKQAAAAKIADQLQAANQASAQQRLNVARDEAVANLIAGGVTKASDIMKAMNDAGWELTAKDINGVISDVQPKGSDSDLYKFSNDDVGKLLGAGINAGTIQALSDYYNGRSDGSDLGNLSTGQQAVVQRVLNGKTTGSDDGNYGSTVSWDAYLQEVQNQLGMEINPDSDLYKKAQADYNSIKGVALGKLTATEKNTLARAGLGGSPSSAQAYFLSTQPAFQDSFARDAAAGTVDTTLEGLHKAYEDWTASNDSSSSKKIEDLKKALSS